MWSAQKQTLKLFNTYIHHSGAWRLVLAHALLEELGPYGFNVQRPLGLLDYADDIVDFHREGDREGFDDFRENFGVALDIPWFS